MIKLRSLLAVTLGIAMLGVFAAGAAAAPIGFGGNPLTVYVDELGQCQTSYLIRGETSGNFYPGGGNSSFFSPTADCGFFIATPSLPKTGLKAQPTDLRGEAEAGVVFGFNGKAGPFINTQYVPVSNGPVTGSGTAADPFKLVTVYDVTDSTENAAETGKNAVLQITQTATYVTGNPYFTAYYDVKNVTDTLPASGGHADPDAEKTIYYRAIYAGDLFVNGDDHGTGVFLAGPPRFVGGQNQTSGVLGGFQEELKGLDGSPMPAWSSFAEDYWSSSEEGGGIWHAVENSANAPSAFPDSVSPTDFDNGAGVAWDTNYSENHGLEPGQEQKYAIVNFTTIPSSLQVSPVSQALPQGVTATITVKAFNIGNQPYANTNLRFTIAGANPQSGVVTTDAQGVAQIHYVGSKPGADLVSMYLDLGNTSTQVAADPTGTAQVTFVATPPPPPNSSVAVKSIKVNSDGSITIVYVPSDSGTGTLSVTVPTASVARHHKVRKCRKGTVKIRGRCLPRTSVFGSATGQGTAGVPLALTVKPSSAAAKSLRKGHSLHVIAILSYQSAKGGPASTHVYRVTLKGKKHRHKHHRH
jgi:hypothetical protein